MTNTTPPTPPRTTEQPGAVKETGSPLYRRFIENSEDDLMRKVWLGTPWITDVFTDTLDSRRRWEIVKWCQNNFGGEAWPIHGITGKWHSGGATIDGYTWIGFETEPAMEAFKAAWPNPLRAARPTTAPGSTVRPASERGTTG